MECKLWPKIKKLFSRREKNGAPWFEEESRGALLFSIYNCFLDKIFSVSLFIKIGVIILLCFLGYTSMTSYFVVQLERIKGAISELDTVYLPEYKAGHILLRQLENIDYLLSGTNYLQDEKWFEEARNKLLDHIRQANKIIASMIHGGRVQDVSRDILIDEFVVRPVKSEELLSILKEIRKDFANIEEKVASLGPEQFAQEKQALLEKIRKIEKRISRFIQVALGKHLVQTQNIERIIRRGEISGTTVTLFLVSILLASGVLFVYTVLKPIKEITVRIRQLAEGEEQCQETLLDIRSRDEIGMLAHEFNRLIKQINEFNLFKKIIEEDETVEDIYQRLAHVFKNRLGLKTFAIFQITNSENKMKPVYLCPPDLEFNREKLGDANRCRAKRTGHVISSLEYPGICRLFLHKDEVDHVCIPMVVGGRTVGVVQFILPRTKESRELHRYDWALRQAKVYIREAIPVIEAKRFAQSMREMALKDPLTGLYNRRFLETYIDTLVAGILRRGTALGVLMCDLDFFKQVNDTYGHEVGDEVLKNTAQILKSNIRTSDLAIRFGGEEFLILLSDVRAGEAVKVAEKLRQLVERAKFKVPGGQIQKTISIGVSEFPIDSEGIWEVIKYADVALYKAKEMGRNRVVRFTPEMWNKEAY
ncbi:MAG: diguanylate cyclase [Thermodesulfobacteria bacterium]|nr:diguanylate cyclase [Thermodesulfobacteriota bacterium]